MVGEGERRERAGAGIGDVAGSEDRERPGLLLTDLLNDFEELTALFLFALRRQSWLNAYLLSAGMSQIVEDYLYADGYFLHKAAPYLAAIQWPFGLLTAGTARCIDGAYVRLRDLHPRIRQVARWHARMSELVKQLAHLVVLDELDTATDQKLQVLGRRLCESARRLPTAVQRAIVRLPSCFRSFDQRPADLDLLVKRLRDRVSDPSTPMVVLGVRTSGSYLAPLIGALLHKRGFRDVEVLTLRPGYPLPAAWRSTLRARNREGGLVLLTDDPPTSGYALSLAADALTRAGVPARSIVLLLQLFTSEPVLPPNLTSYQSVLLRWDEWTVHQQMRPSEVRRALTDLLAPALTVENVERLPLTDARPARGHAQGLYRVEVVERRSGQSEGRRVYVSGVGLGYFGDHSLAIARRLKDLVPAVYGVSDGLLFRSWEPEEHRLSASQLREQPTSLKPLIDYVQARREALPVHADRSLRLIGRQPGWEVASNILSRAFGRAWFLVRIPLVDPVVRRIVRVRNPSVVDGSMAPSHWFMTNGPDGRFLKVDFERRAFSNLDLSCYDSAYDLASLAVDLDIEGLQDESETDVADRLRGASKAAAGETVSPERWLLHQLVHLWDLDRSSGRESEVRRAGARAMQRYFAETVFNDVVVPSGGAICGLDLDGVLETEPFGFATLTRSSAVALRALLRHGYQPVLVTGRSLAEVRDRCRSYRLAGGVAEYGGVVYNHHTGGVRPVMSDSSRDELDRIREALLRVDGVCIDRDYRYSVRAYELCADGTRRGLPSTLIERVLSDSGLQGRVLPIAGESQTDFVVSTVNKATGLRVLANDLAVECDVDHGKHLALAVGDTVTDLPVFSLAKLAAAPGHAEERVRRAGVTVLKRKYQAGLAEAVAGVIGHRPGGCDVCQSSGSVESRLLLTIVSAQEQGVGSMLTSAFLLAVRNFISRIESV
jgi:hydroxymethylpyrimidine pyrophosphatase-like HAD family hydrolase